MPEMLCAASSPMVEDTGGGLSFSGADREMQLS